ncbi:MAG TPA: hypothetical protein V6C57_19945 [Coleofasciculaceae cyanobacterium]
MAIRMGTSIENKKINAVDIQDSSTTGRSVLTGTAAAGRTALGTVAGPGTSTTGAVPKFSNTIGDLANSTVTINGSGDLAIASTTSSTSATSAALVVSGGASFSNSLYVDAAGSTTSAPRNISFGIGTGNAARLQFSTGLNSYGCSTGGRTIIQSFFGIQLAGNRQQGTALAFSSAVGTDPSLLVLGTLVGAPVLVARCASGQTASGFEVQDSNSTSVFSVSAAGNAAIAGTLKLGSYTTATLPTAGTAGRIAYATDARWSGGIGCDVEDNGSIWLTLDGCQASTTGYQRTLTANRTLDRTDRIIWTSTAAITITLPAVSTNKYVPYRIRNISAGSITIAATGTDTVEGAASVSLAAGASYNLENDGTSAWRNV